MWSRGKARGKHTANLGDPTAQASGGALLFCLHLPPPSVQALFLFYCFEIFSVGCRKLSMG